MREIQPMSKPDSKDEREATIEDSPMLVRIAGKPGDVRGYMLTVTDVATGLQVEGIYKVMLILDAEDNSKAVLFRYKTDVEGRYITKRSNLLVEKIRLKNPIIDVSALATMMSEDEVKADG
jgi:hypothetical protein